MASPAAFAADFGSGLRIGPTFSRFSGEDADGQAARRLGVAVHLVGEVIATPVFSVRGELGYVSRGDVWETRFLGQTARVETRLRYFEFPLLLRVKLPIPVVAPYVEGGGFGAILLDADLLSRSEDREINDATHRGDYGVAVGGGLIVDAKVISVIGGVRWSRGFNPVFDGVEGLDFESREPQVYNSSLAAHVGLSF